MKMKRYSKLILALAILGFAGYTRSATTNVLLGNYFFNPKDLTITAGDTVVWTNASIDSHTVTGTGSDPICGAGTVGSACSHTFNTPGTYPYICTSGSGSHAAFGMTGVVRVVSAPVPTTPALLTNMAVLPGGYSRFDVFSTAMRTNLVQASTNLALSNWTTISTVVPPTNSFTVTDSNAPGFELRFYRVVQP
jgi:plastocyanin